jgi:hypothetical protein
LTLDDFAVFRPETVEPISVAFRGLTVLTSPPNTHGFLLLRALRAVDELGITDPFGHGLGVLMRVFHRGNELRASHLADPRHVDVDVAALINEGLAETAALGAAQSGPALVPHGDTVGVAAADDDGYAVSLIQSVYHAFGSGLIDSATGILFHNRGTGFSLDDASPNVIAPRKRPAHTLMPVMTTYRGRPRHVLATMGGQGQPQILTQVLLRALGGAGAEAAVSDPRAVVGLQADGGTADSVTAEADLLAVARASIGRAGLASTEVAPHTENLGHANVVFADESGSMTAAADPRSDGARSSRTTLVSPTPGHRRPALVTPACQPRLHLDPHDVSLISPLHRRRSVHPCCDTARLAARGAPRRVGDRRHRVVLRDDHQQWATGPAGAPHRPVHRRVKDRACGDVVGPRAVAWVQSRVACHRVLSRDQAEIPWWHADFQVER